jgi:Flp pilus assembly protein TadG
MVEFVAVVTPLMLIVVAIIQFGLLFGANVTITNAAREGARAGTIYVYDRTESAYWNDAHRCAAIVGAATAAFGLLTVGSPHFNAPISSGACPTPTSTTLVNGDVTISYCASVASSTAPCPNSTVPATACTVDTREGCLVRVVLRYRSDIIVPLLDALLPHDGSNRFLHTVSATMVVN